MKRKYANLFYTEYTVADGNFDTSRAPVIDRIIIHTTVGTKEGAIARFGKSGTGVSAHYLVTWEGELIAFLEEYYTAYHAGNYQMNQRSIGIEHEDKGNYTSVRPDALYETSSRLVADICKFYNIPCDREHILKHNEITATGCPHNLDIDRIIKQANEILGKSSQSNSNYYQGIDLKNIDSIKICIDTWKAVVDGKYIKKEDYDKTINDLKNQIEQIKAEKGNYDALLSQKNSLAVQLDECQKQMKIYKAEYDNATKEGGYIEQIKYLEE
jgi:hypothetical protein